MALGVILFAAWLVFMAITVVGFFVWALKEGHLKDIEEPKFRVLLDREPEPWPGREKRRSGKPEKESPAVQTKGEGE